MRQDLRHLKKVIITLDSGEERAILTDNVPKGFGGELLTLTGMINTPLLVRKTILVRPDDISCIEIIDDPHIVWGDAITEVDIGGV